MLENPLFDAVASDYDKWYQTEQGYAVDQAERALINKMFKPNGIHVLEVGCGTGQYTVELAKLGYSVTAVDISSVMIRYAKEKLQSMGLKARWALADINEYVEKTDLYHGILSVTAFEFIPNPEIILRKLFNHLESGGCLVVGVIAGQSLWCDLYTTIAAQNPDSVFTHARFYTEQDIVNWEIGGTLEIGRTLYFSPSVVSFNEAMEQEENQQGNPGFLVAKWVKE